MSSSRFSLRWCSEVELGIIQTTMTIEVRRPLEIPFPQPQSAKSSFRCSHCCVNWIVRNTFWVNDGHDVFHIIKCWAEIFLSPLFSVASSWLVFKSAFMSFYLQFLFWQLDENSSRKMIFSPAAWKVAIVELFSFSWMYLLNVKLTRNSICFSWLALSRNEGFCFVAPGQIFAVPVLHHNDGTLKKVFEIGRELNSTFSSTAAKALSIVFVSSETQFWVSWCSDGNVFSSASQALLYIHLFLDEIIIFVFRHGG